MRIIHVHVHYSTELISGENEYVNELDTFFKKDHEVLSYFPKFDRHRIGVFKAFHIVVSYLTINCKLLKQLNQYDCLVFHNTVPFVSSWTLYLASRIKPVIKVWHNHRSFCIKGTEFRSGIECKSCTQSIKGTLVGILSKCYRNSYLQSAIVTLAEYSNRKFKNTNYLHVVSSKYMYNRVQEWLGPNVKIQIIEGVAKPYSFDKKKVTSCRNDFAFVGRLEFEKGIENLIQAWKQYQKITNIDSRMHVIGSGPLLEQLKDLEIPNLIFYGLLSGEEMLKVLKNCKTLFVTSLVKETFGRVAAEGLLLGMRLVVPPYGAPKEMVIDEDFGQILNSLSVQCIINALNIENQIDGNLGLTKRINFAKKYSVNEWETKWNKFLSQI